MPSEDTNVKKFGLKPIETRLIAMQQQLHQAALGNMLSFIAMERCAYEVTPNTQFEIDDQNMLNIWEAEPPKEEPVAEAPQPVVPNSSVSEAAGAK